MKKFIPLFGIISIIGAMNGLLYLGKTMYREPRLITIWIHGTRGASFLPIGISKQAKEIEYNMCSCPVGLQRACDIDDKFHNATLAHTLSQANEKEFPLDSFYTFGWTGNLDSKARKHAAQHLKESLQDLAYHYFDADGIAPRFTLITHSHGGNVALNLGRLCTQKELHIDRLILLACPVQKETEEYTSCPVFKNIYSIHSHADNIQVLDPQKFHPYKKAFAKAWKEKSINPFAQAFKESRSCPLFSKRHFKPQSHIKQIQVQWKTKAPWNEHDIKPFKEFGPTIKKVFEHFDIQTRGLLHIEFILPTFISELPNILKQAETMHPDHKIETDMMIYL